MIKERYCSYELSKLLKEKGFDESCRAYWWDERDVLAFCDFPKTTEDLRYKDSQYLAPTHQMACDWLRNKGYNIEIYANASGYRFIISKIPPDGTDLVNNIEGTNDGGAWDDYSECVEAAMNYCLTKMI